MLPAGVCKVVETDLRTVCLCIFSYGGGFDGQGGRLDNFPVTAKWPQAPLELKPANSAALAAVTEILK